MNIDLQSSEPEGWGRGIVSTRTSQWDSHQSSEAEMLPGETREAGRGRGKPDGEMRGFRETGKEGKCGWSDA